MFLELDPGRLKLRYKSVAVIATIALAFVMSGCETTNENTANINANANAPAVNANTPVPNTNANETTRRGPTREEYERDKDRYTREAKESGRTVGTGINDGWLWAKTRFELAAVDDLRDSTINVDVDKAVVTLTGTVASAAQKTKAEQTAKTVEGVTSVKNMLKVASDNSNAKNANAPKAK